MCETFFIQLLSKDVEIKDFLGFLSFLNKDLTIAEFLEKGR